MFHLHELGPLADQLAKDLPDARLDPRGIANFQMGFLQFMEDALGVRVRRHSVCGMHAQFSLQTTRC